MFKKLFASSLFRYAAVAVLLIAVTLSFPQTRALASQLLNLFRVQQVAILPVDFSGMKDMTGQNAMGERLGKMLSSSITSAEEPSKPVVTTDVAEARKLAGFALRLPADKTPAQILVTAGTAFAFKIDQVKAQALLEEAGRGDLILPASIDGKEVSVTIPAGISASFGNCPAFETSDDAKPTRESDKLGEYIDCILLAEIPSPTVSAPAEVNVGQLIQVMLEFTGMSREEAAAYTASVDWTTTLVIPIQKNAATYKQISVDGVTGTLIEGATEDESGFSLIWVKDGVIHAIAGNSSNLEKALQMANSLP